MSKSLKSVHSKTGNMSDKERDLAEQQEAKMHNSLARIKAPAWLETKLKHRFNWYSKQMKELNVLTILDASVLARYVYYEQRFLDLDNLIVEKGYETDDGRISPFLNEQRQVQGLIERMEVKLGLNPTDRLRFAQQDVEQIDELEAFKNEL